MLPPVSVKCVVAYVEAGVREAANGLAVQVETVSDGTEGPVGVHESVDVGVTLVRSMIRTRGGSAGGNSVTATVATRGTGSPRRQFPCTFTRDGTGSWQRRRGWSPFRRVGHWAGTIKPRAIPADVRRTRRVCTAWFGSAPSGSTGHGVAAGAVRTALAA
jgi:hypothetical protein